jgi:hypothetical protein
MLARSISSFHPFVKMVRHDPHRTKKARVGRVRNDRPGESRANRVLAL